MESGEYRDRAEAEGLSRRAFLRGSAGAGAAAAVVWSAPTLRTIRPAQAAGSPPPPGVGGVGGPPGGKAPLAGDPGLVTDPTSAPGNGPGGGAGGTLPVTGIEVVPMVATGAAAIVTGHALVGVERRRAEYDDQVLDLSGEGGPAPPAPGTDAAISAAASIGSPNSSR